MIAISRRAAIGTGLLAPFALAATNRERPWIGVDWPRALSASMGLDHAALAKAADALGAAGERQGLVIIRDRRLVFERYWANDFHRADPDWRNVTFSAGKSWGATMVGRAVTQHRLSIGDRADLYVPAEKTGLNPAVTIRDLLTMTSGGTMMVKPSSHPPRLLAAPDTPVAPDEYRRNEGHAAARGAPAGYAETLVPGTTFFYDGAAVDHIAEIVAAAVRMPSYDYIMREVVRAIGCRHTDYQPEGVDSHRDIRIGGSMLTTCRDLARLGQFYLDDGQWNGRRLIDPAFIRAAIAPSPRNPDYGFLWWLNTSGKIAQAPRSMYFAAGARGQFCFVIPETRTIIATMGFGKAELSADAAWAALGPALT